MHCGFCLPACPTYQLWGEEMDSPRGRIALIARLADGAPVSASVAAHLDACLGCLACVPACPSGVRYDRLLELTRPQVESDVHRPAASRALRAALFALFCSPRRLRVVRLGLRAYQASGVSGYLRASGRLERLAPRLAAIEALAPPVGPRVPLPELVPARGARRATVGLLTGCVQDAFFSTVNAATARVLAAEGVDVLVPAGQGCCGALPAHVGRRAQARQLARAVVDAFRGRHLDAVVVNVAGCGSMLKGYADLLADDPGYAGPAAELAARSRDISEFLAELGPRATRHPLAISVAYHEACHLGHGQGVRAQPRALLRGVPGVQLRELADPSTCCGSAGVYNLLAPGPAGELGDRKAADVLASGADLLVTANPGCLLQIRAALARTAPAEARPPLAHPIEVLDASIRGLPAAHLLDRRQPAPVSRIGRAPHPARPAGA